MSTVEDWKARMNKSLKSEVVGSVALNIPRLSTGSVTLDLALGGGLPFSRGVGIVGEYSTGKSAIAQKACASVENYDHATKRHLDFIPGGSPGRALYVDVEGTVDPAWAKCLGLDFDKNYPGTSEKWHCLARPEYAEAAIDIIASALYEDLFDVIVLDSVASLTPSKEIEETAESNQVGLAARQLNKAVRVWQSSLLKVSNRGSIGPCVILTNQYRLKPGTPMGMDPRVLPVGKGQDYFYSVTITTQATSYDDKNDVELAEITFKGAVKKNKTAVPRQGYEFSLAQKPYGELQKGEIDNLQTLIRLAKEYNLLAKADTGSGWKLGSKEYATQKEIIETMRIDPKFQRLLWRSVVKQATGYVEA